MSGSRVAIVLVETLAFVLAALCLGELVLSGCERFVVWATGAERSEDRDPSVTRFGLAVLVGLGSAGYIGVLLGLAHIFSWIALLVAFLALLVLGRATLARYLAGARRALRPHIRGGAKRLTGSDLWWLLGVGVIVAVLTADYAASFAPPTTPDELSYHLPQAEMLVHTHQLPLTLGQHYFYGNIPKLLEVLFAEAIAVSGGFELAHVVHLLIAVAFLVFLYGTIRSFFGRRPAVLAVLFVVLYDEFMTNATTGLIDAAGVSFEVGALLAFASWLERRHPEDIARTALLIGLALSVKYTPAPTLLFLIVAFGAVLIASRMTLRASARLGAAAGVILVTGCGFWYLKNAARFGNPFYPLYFGHRGVSEVAYKGLVQAIQVFGPRTPHQFVRIPYRYARFSDLLVFLSFYLSPFALLIPRARKFSRCLFVFFVLYTAYWFFLATHLTRFLMSAVVVGLILLAITFHQLEALLPRALMVGAAVAAIVFTNPQILQNPRADLITTAHLKLRGNTLRYAVGLRTENAYLQPYFGCHFSTIHYLSQRHLAGNVIDNWSQWHDYALTLFETSNGYRSFAGSARGATLWAKLRDDDLRYVYLRTSLKAAFAKETDPQEVAYRDARIRTENAILEHSTLIWKQGDCRLYRIDAASGA